MSDQPRSIPSGWRRTPRDAEEIRERQAAREAELERVELAAQRSRERLQRAKAAASKEAVKSTRHPMSQAFVNTLQAMVELHDRKQADYGRTDDPFANVRASEDFGIPGWVGALVRMNDKMRRLQAAARGQQLKNESIEDSFMDLAVYAVIGLLLFTEDKK